MDQKPHDTITHYQQETYYNYNDIRRLKAKRWEKIYHNNTIYRSKQEWLY